MQGVCDLGEVKGLLFVLLTIYYTGFINENVEHHIALIYIIVHKLGEQMTCHLRT